MSNVETSLSVFVNDLDMKSFYPSTMRCGNIARDTLRSAVFMIEGRHQSEIQDYFTGIINQRENSVLLCAKFHGYPGYTEMADFIRNNSIDKAIGETG